MNAFLAFIVGFFSSVEENAREERHLSWSLPIQTFSIMRGTKLFTLQCVLLIPYQFASSTNAQSLSAEELFRQAQKASRESDYAQAEKLYRRGLASDPS